MRLLSNVRPGEGRIVASAFLTLLGITAAHAMLETARDALFLAKLPATHLAVMYLAIAAVGLFLARVGAAPPSPGSSGRVMALSLGFASLINAAFWVSLREGTPPWLLCALYIWTGTFASWLVLRFWLLLGATLTAAQARRLFGLIGAGSVLGAVSGSGMARLLVHSADVRVLLVASVVLLATAVGPALWIARVSPANNAAAPQVARESLGTDLRLVRESPYLSRVISIALISTVALTLVDYLFKAAVAARGGSVAELATFFATTYFVLNLLALVVQSVGVDWLLRLLGVHTAFLVLPAVLLLCSGGVVASGALLAVLALKGADGALRHSLHRTCVELLFVPLADGVRARAKPLVDLLGQRGGQALASLAIILVAALPSGRWMLELTLVALCGAWAFLVVGLRAHYIDAFRFALPGSAEAAKASNVEGSLELRYEAARLLDSLLYASDVLARAASLDTLQRLRRNHPETPIEPNGLRRALDRALREAYASIGASIETTDAGIHDERRSATERVFRLLSLLEPKASYDLIYSGLMSDDARVHALSLELCENVSRRELRPALVKLVDRIPDEERLEGAAPYYVRPRPALQLACAALAGKVLDGSDFRGANLCGADLSAAKLRNARFEGADLRGADLSGVDARGALFDGAQLEGARLGAANLLGARGVGAVFVGSTGQGVSFESGDWSEADFSYCRLEAPNFDNASLRGTRFAHARLARASFRAVEFVEVVFDDADLERAQFAISQLSDCSLQRARICDSRWELSDLDGSRFDDSQCSGMTWFRCGARGVVFRASDISGANWQESRIRNADFTRANFEGATLVDTGFVRTTFVLAQLRKLITTRIRLVACDLRDADTEGTKLPRNHLALLSEIGSKRARRARV